MAADERRSDAQRLLDELGYWGALLDDLRALNDELAAIVPALFSGGPLLLDLAMIGGEPGRIALRLNDQLRDGRRALEVAGRRLEPMLELVDGRRRMMVRDWNDAHPELALELELGDDGGDA